MKKIDGRTREGRILARKRAAMAKARRALAKLRRERKKVITPGEAIKVTGEWLSPEVVKQMTGDARIEEPFFVARVKMPEDHPAWPATVLDAYGPSISGGRGKATSAYWRVGV